jgi:hypothetical protein
VFFPLLLFLPRICICSFEKESGIHFDFKHLEDLIRNGQFKEAEDYVTPFAAKLPDFRIGFEASFHLRKQKYLEALNA